MGEMGEHDTTTASTSTKARTPITAVALIMVLVLVLVLGTRQAFADHCVNMGAGGGESSEKTGTFCGTTEAKGLECGLEGTGAGSAESREGGGPGGGSLRGFWRVSGGES